MTDHPVSNAPGTVTSDIVVATLLDRRAERVRPVVFDNVVVTGTLDERYLDVAAELVFRDCVFRDAVTLHETSFSRSVRFLGCRFEAGVSLDASRIPDLHLGASASGPTIVMNHFGLNDCRITGTVECSATRFEGLVSLIGAHIDGSVWLEDALFSDAVDLRYLRVDGQLLCDRAHFEARVFGVRLEGSTIGDAYFDSARFIGPVDCGRLSITGELSFEQTHFQREVDFNGLSVGGRAFFDEARFVGDVDFGGARVTRQLSCQRAHFHEAVSFNGAEAGDTFFTGSKFHGPADFTRLTVNGQLVCDGVRFSAGADLGGVRAADLFLDGAQAAGAVNLSQCIIAGDLVVAGARFAGPVDLSGTQIGGALAVFTAPGDERPDEATRLPADADLRGLSYKRTDLEVDREARERWTELCGRGATFEPQPYLVLEQVLRSGGRDEAANRVHYDMRVAEARHFRERMGRWLRGGRADLSALLGLAWNRFLQFSVGYGVYGYRLVFWVGAVLIVASILAHFGYRYGYITPTKEWKDERFIPYLYAIDSFLPVIGLTQRKFWTPTVGIAPHLAAILLVLGWATVPLLVGLVTGALKKKDSR